MKKPVILYVAAMAVSSILFWGCNSGPDLTPETQEGKNTFSCKINGKVWVPEEKVYKEGTVKPIYGGYMDNLVTGSKSLHLRTFNTPYQEIAIYLRSATVGKHLINNNTIRRDELADPENYGWVDFDGKVYMTSRNSTGWINITRADSTGVISGTFEFNATTATGKKIRITDGRFDIVSTH